MVKTMNKPDKFKIEINKTGTPYPEPADERDKPRMPSMTEAKLKQQIREQENKIKEPGKLHVEILAHTPDPEVQVARAARLCYYGSGIEDLKETMTPEKAAELVRKLVSMGHFSPVEHVTFTFGIEGISRALSHQLVRHRIASYSQQSQRYVDGGKFSYIMPPSIENNPEAKELFLEQMEKDYECYEKLTKLGIPKEDARFVLPNACDTKVIATMNVRSLYNFFQHRCCNRAQWEIRALAWEMLRQCKSIAPILFENAGPDCLTTGKCNEGNMSCGKPYTKKPENN